MSKDHASDLPTNSGEDSFFGSGHRAEEWRSFERLADALVTELAPRTALVVNCGSALLVASLRKRGVKAFGIDVSEDAVGQVPSEFRRFCSVASVTEELDRDYDLIVCMTVLEHLPLDLASAAIENLSRHTDSVLFSANPDVPHDLGRVQVHPMEYWVELFAQYGFLRNVALDADFASPHAIHFRRSPLTTSAVAATYERWYWRNLTELRELRSAQSEAQEALAATRNELERQRAAARSALAALDALRRTRTFRYTAPARTLYRRLRGHRHSADVAYHAWLATFDTLADPTRALILDEIASFSSRPLISILLPVADPHPLRLEQTLASVRSQLYEHWELCVADSASTSPQIRRTLADFQATERRVKAASAGASEHTSSPLNAALQIAAGDYIAPLSVSDELAEYALYVAVREINRHPDVRLIYTDADSIDEKGRRFAPQFKPDWNPDLFRSSGYVGRLGVYATNIVREVGTFRHGFEDPPDYDLSLRVVERIRDDQIRHVPALAYHSRGAARSTHTTAPTRDPPTAWFTLRALEDHLQRTNRRGLVPASQDGLSVRVRYPLGDEPPRATLIIPTRDGVFLRSCVESVRRLTEYPNYEIIIVDNRSSNPDTLSYLQSLEMARSARILRYDSTFNHSAMNNYAVQQAEGRVLCLLNDDVEVVTGDWLYEMISHAMRSEIGAVGAKLLYADRRVQHAGVLLGVIDVAGHAHRFSDAESPGYMGRAGLVQNYSAVTGACLVVRREVYEDVEGLDAQNFPDLYNDVDFCLRLRQAGYWNLWTPYAVLVHHESITRKLATDDHETHARSRTDAESVKRRWAKQLAGDPAYNPNLTLSSEDFALAWPPRVDWPWITA